MVDTQYVSSSLQKLSGYDCLDAVKSVHQGCDVNIKSIQDGEVFDMCVGSLISWCKPNYAVTFSIAFPSWLDLSWQHQFFDLIFKSRTNIID